MSGVLGSLRPPSTQAKGTGQQVLLLPLCQIKELFYKRLSGEEDEEEEEEGSRTPTAKPGSKGMLNTPYIVRPPKYNRMPQKEIPPWADPAKIEI